jgi:putative FmdB family regulatory protein
MPIYEYRCSSCGVRKEHLQKVSDPKLTVCPECGKETYEKQLTAAGFQLKGSGWYATDFKGSPSAKKDDSGTAKDGVAEGGSKDAGSAKDAGSKDSGGDKPAAAASTAPASSTPAGSA